MIPAWEDYEELLVLCFDCYMCILYISITFTNNLALISLYTVIFISMVLLRIPTAVQPMTGIKGFKSNIKPVTVKEV